MIIVLESNDRLAELANESLARVRPPMPVVVCRTEEETVACVQRRRTEENEPTIVLLDLEGRSPEILSKLKVDSASWRTVVVVLGRAKCVAEINECYRLGCNAYITRPENETDFAEAVNTLRLFLEAIRMPGGTSEPFAIAAGGGGDALSSPSITV